MKNTTTKTAHPGKGLPVNIKHGHNPLIKWTVKRSQRVIRVQTVHSISPVTSHPALSDANIRHILDRFSDAEKRHSMTHRDLAMVMVARALRQDTDALFREIEASGIRIAFLDSKYKEVFHNIGGILKDVRLNRVLFTSDILFDASYPTYSNQI